MIQEFLSSKQNYKDMMTMIESTRKKDNQVFGQEIVQATEAMRLKKEKQAKPKKNYLAAHN